MNVVIHVPEPADIAWPAPPAGVEVRRPRGLADLERASAAGEVLTAERFAEEVERLREGRP